jgi:hypothetical protein
MAEEKEKVDPELRDGEDDDDLVKRKIPIIVGGTFVSSLDIIETSKDLLIAEMPELLQIDVHSGNDGEFDSLALECLWHLFKKSDMVNVLVAYDTYDLQMCDMPNFILVGMPIMVMQPDETKITFLEKVKENIFKLNINFKHIAVYNQPDEEDEEDGPPLEMIFVNDIFNFTEEREDESDVDDLDIGYEKGFEAGTNSLYEGSQIALFKLWSKKRLPVDNFYEFMDDLNSTIKGFNDSDYKRYKKKYDDYLKDYDKEEGDTTPNEKK